MRDVMVRELAGALPSYGLDLEESAVRRLAEYLELLVQWNRKLRLVGSADVSTLVRRHVAESLMLGRLLPLREQRLVDVGSGAGFPGMALQLAWPALQVTLIEANAKKAAFLKTVVRTLGMGTVLLGRLEEAQVEGDIVTARALEHMEEAGPDRYRPLVAPAGIAAFWIGEATAAQWRSQFAGWEWGESFTLPGSERRTITLAGLRS